MRPTHALALLLAPACALLAPDLPDGWEDAEPVDHFTQADCEGSPYDTGWSESMSASTGGPGIRVVGDPLHFRCAQDVEGFTKTESTTTTTRCSWGRSSRPNRPNRPSPRRRK